MNSSSFSIQSLLSNSVMTESFESHDWVINRNYNNECFQLSIHYYKIWFINWTCVSHYAHSHNIYKNTHTTLSVLQPCLDHSNRKASVSSYQSPQGAHVLLLFLEFAFQKSNHPSWQQDESLSAHARSSTSGFIHF